MKDDQVPDSPAIGLLGTGGSHATGGFVESNLATEAGTATTGVEVEAEPAPEAHDDGKKNPQVRHGTATLPPHPRRKPKQPLIGEQYVREYVLVVFNRYDSTIDAVLGPFTSDEATKENRKLQGNRWRKVTRQKLATTLPEWAQ